MVKNEKKNTNKKEQTMKVKVAQLLEYLKQKKMTVEDFAKKLHLSTDEVEKLLAGKAVGINTARKFISGLSAELAQDLIDWDAIGIKNPLANDKKEGSEEDLFDGDEDYNDDYGDDEDYGGDEDYNDDYGDDEDYEDDEDYGDDEDYEDEDYEDETDD